MRDQSPEEAARERKYMELVRKLDDEGRERLIRKMTDMLKEQNEKKKERHSQSGKEE